MKNLIIILLVLVIMVLGFLLIHLQAHRNVDSGTSKLPPGVTAVSNGGFTWYVGPVIINGSNVPANQLHLRAVQSTNLAPETNEITK